MSEKMYRFVPEAINNCTPEKRVEIFSGLMGRLDLFHSALEAEIKIRLSQELGTKVIKKEVIRMEIERVLKYELQQMVMNEKK